jgi:hypothetical protein
VERSCREHVAPAEDVVANRGNFLEMNHANLSPDKKNRPARPPELHTVFSTPVENLKKTCIFKYLEEFITESPAAFPLQIRSWVG